MVVARRCRYQTSPSSSCSLRSRIAWTFDCKPPNAAVAHFCTPARPKEIGAAAAPVSRTEWVFLAQYVQAACEELSGSTRIARPESFSAVLEALLAVRSLRSDRGGGRDRFYLGNLGVPVATIFSEHQFDPELLPRAVGNLMHDLRRGATSPKGVIFAGRNL